jgi:hypothetical protein
MNNFDYKKYSLENLEKWIEDAINSSEASPQEIYDVIKKVVEENYCCYKNHTERCYELLALLNGNGKGHLSCNKDDKSAKCQNALNDFWEENYYPEEHMQYTEEELNAMCDKVESDEKKLERAHPDFDRNRTYDEMIAAGYTMTADGFWIKEPKEDKVVKWQLPVELDGLTGECYVNLPDDLLESANIKEGNMVRWIDHGDGSFELRKVTKPIGMEEC